MIFYFHSLFWKHSSCFFFFLFFIPSPLIYSITMYCIFICLLFTKYSTISFAYIPAFSVNLNHLFMKFETLEKLKEKYNSHPFLWIVIINVFFPSTNDWFICSWRCLSRVYEAFQNCLKFLTKILQTDSWFCRYFVLIT